MIRSIYGSLKGSTSLWDPQESSHLHLSLIAMPSCPQSVSYGAGQQANGKNTPSSVESEFGNLLRERFTPKCEFQPL